MSDWYCQLDADGSMSGPYTIDELQFLKARGTLRSDAQVRAGLEGPWNAASAIPDLFPIESFTSAHTSSGVADHGDPASSVDVKVPASTESRRLPTRSKPPKLDTTERKPEPTRSNRNAMVSRLTVGAVIIAILACLFVWLSQHRTVERSASDQVGWDTRRSGTTSRGPQDESVARDNEVVQGDPRELNELPQQDQSLNETTERPLGDFTIQELQTQHTPPEATAEGGGLGDVNERLDREGGQTGEVQVTLVWNNVNDLDLHVVCPSGEEIHYNHKRSRCSGQLDVDMNAGPNRSNEPVENVFWPVGSVPKGEYVVAVKHYANHGGDDPTKFKVAVTQNGTTRTFSGALSFGAERRVHRFHQ